jgi:hypothetical protein
MKGKNSTRDRWTDNCDVAGKYGSNTSTLSLFLKDRISRTALIPMQMDCIGKESTLKTKKTWTKLYTRGFWINYQRTLR